MENNLPKGWEEIELSFLVAYKKGKKPKRMENKPFDNSLVYLDIRAIETKNDEIYVDAETSNATNEGELVVVWDGARAGWVGKSREGALGSTLMGLKPKINRDYLYRFIQTQFDYLQTNHRGTGIPHVDPDIFWNIKVPIAPQKEQRRIVAKLDELMEKIDRSRARLEHIPKILKRFRQSILSAAVSGKLTEEWRSKNVPDKDAESFLLNIQANRQRELEIAIDLFEHRKGKKPKNIEDNFAPEFRIDDNYPITWRVTRIKDVAECLDYIRKPINKDERAKRLGSIPYYGANGQVGWIDDYLFDEDLVVVVEDETFVGREIPFSYIIRGKAWVNNHAHVLRPLGMMSVEYLNACLAYYNFTPLTSGTTGRRKLNQGALMEAELPIAPLSEQREIVQRIEHLFALADKIESRYNKGKSQLDKLPQSLLAKAFRGELVPQDERDEPASLLLSRINEKITPRSVKKTRTKEYPIRPLASIGIAAKPKSKYSVSVSVKIPENKRAFAKQVLGGKIVSLFKDDPHFTHIKFQKLQYLAEHLAEVDLNWNYYRQSAGPYDPKFMHTIAFKFKASKWFEERKYKFFPLEKADRIEGYYEGYFKPAAAKLDSLFTLLKNCTEEDAEIIATLYAVWNNMIIKKENIDDHAIVSTFFEWSDRKKNYTQKQVSKTVSWMKENDIVPNGFGKVIKEKRL